MREKLTYRTTCIPEARITLFAVPGRLPHNEKHRDQFLNSQQFIEKFAKALLSLRKTFFLFSKKRKQHKLTMYRARIEQRTQGLLHAIARTRIVAKYVVG